MNLKLAAMTVLFAGAAMTGCAEMSYQTPGARADFSKIGLTEEEAKSMTDGKVRDVLGKKPMVVFPATIAVTRVQGNDYGPNRYYSGRSGNYSVVTQRDVEKDEDFARLKKLPQVSDVGIVPRILLPTEMRSDVDLRAAAAKLHSNLLLFYTFDTHFYTDERLKELSVITLGWFPNQSAHVESTASAVLMDVNNGYVYGVYESTSKKEQLANAWTNSDAMDQVRRKAERAAFEGLLSNFEKGWVNVVIEYKKDVKAASEK
jgi:hypothetical protein